MLDNNKTSYLKLILLLFIILLGIVIFFFMLDEKKNLKNVMSYIDDNDVIIFNYDSGYYKKNLKLTMTPNNHFSKDAKIYYTLDGNYPSKKSKLYKKPIIIECNENKTSIYNISALVYYRGKYTKLIQKTYVLDKKINEIYDIPIINLVAKPYDLYDETYGLMAKRNLRLRDKEDAKEAKIFMFDEKGNLVINQNIGLLISGGASSNLQVKSLKLMADYDYDKNNNYFVYNFDSSNTITSQPIKYKNLRLNSGGQDQEHSNIRNNSIQKLALNSNFDGYKDSQRVAVFINGEYYGIMNLEQSFSDSYLKRKYNLPDNKIEKKKMGEKEFFKDIDLYDKLYNINDKKEEFENTLDMDNYLLYYAIELVINNPDWPYKNYEAWHYTGKYDSNNIYTDGKYRFLLFDVDLSYFNYEISKWKNWGVGIDNFERIMKSDDYVFPYIMQNDKYRNKFITIVNNLLNTSFNEKNVLKMFNNEFNLIKDEEKYNMNEEEYNDFEKNFNDTLEVIKNRDDEIYRDIREYLDAKESYNINFKTSKGSLISIENLNIYENSDITYSYNSNNVTIKASSYPGYDFDYFIVNGEKISKNEIQIHKDSKVEVVSKKNNDNLIISEFKSNDDDYIVLKNISDKKLKLKDYYISDNNKDYLKYGLPDVKLNSGETIKIYCKDNYDAKVGDYISSFNLKYKESLYVYNSKEKRIEDELYIPDLNKKEILFRYKDSDIKKIKLQK